jgi:steroid delta-isomerase-like uncharacterized protein
MLRILSIITLVFLLSTIFGCQDRESIADLERMEAQAETEEQNKQIARELFAAIDAGDFDKLNGLFADSFAVDAPCLPEPLRKDMLFQTIKTHYAAFPDWIHVIEDVIAEGDKVAVKLTQNGTHEAEYEGIPATGIQATSPAMHLITVVDGKIEKWFAVEDALGMYMQLGMELKPKEDET